MKKRNLEAQNQILKNYIKAKGLDIDIKKNSEKIKNKNIDSLVYKDLKLTIIYIIGSFGLLFLIRYLNLDFFLNKFI